MRALTFAIAVVSLSVASPAHAQLERLEAVGPYQFGMSTSEVRQLNVTETGSTERGGRIFTARDPVQFERVAFHATINVSPLDYLDRVDLTHQSRLDARRCNELHARIIAALEPRYGAFSPSSYQMRVPDEGPPRPEPVGARSERGIYREYGGDQASNARAQNVYVLYRAQGGNCSIELRLGPWRQMLFQPLPAPSAAQLATAPLAANHRWRVNPSSAVMTAAYPTRAAERQRSGIVQLECIVGETGVLSCAIISEDPGWGFGEAARLVMANSRVQERAPDGSSIVGSRLRIRVAFRPPD